MEGYTGLITSKSAKAGPAFWIFDPFPMMSKFLTLDASGRDQHSIGVQPKPREQHCLTATLEWDPNPISQRLVAWEMWRECNWVLSMDIICYYCCYARHDGCITWLRLAIEEWVGRLSDGRWESREITGKRELALPSKPALATSTLDRLQTSPRRPLLRPSMLDHEPTRRAWRFWGVIERAARHKAFLLPRCPL